MTVLARLFNHDLSGSALPLPSDIKLAVSGYTRAAMGGPLAATINVSGGPDSLAQALSWLRCPVEIYSGNMVDKRWWGLVNGVRLRIGQVETLMALDDMANKVTVVYSRVGSTHPQGERAISASALDAGSVAEYGIKELRYSLNNATDIQAASVAATILKERRYPQSYGPSQGSGAEEASCTLECRGWWDTLKWQYFADVDHSEKFELVSGTDVAQPTIDAGHTRLGQQFQLPNVGDAWTVDSIELLLQVANLTPVGTASVEIWSDSAGSPGAMLTSGSVLGSAIADGASGVKTKVTMTPPLDITGATPYWIVLRKPADATGVSYFEVRWNIAGGYTRGTLKWWDGASWGGADGGKDIYFTINGLVQTTTQIANMVAAAGQFLTGTTVQDASGLYASSYRDGDRTGQAEIEDLLAGGNTSYQRILATVTPERVVVLSAEPISTALPAYQLDRDMWLFDAYGNRASEELCPAGVWIALRNVLPASVALSRFVSPSPFFAEEGRYDAQTNRYTPTPKALGNVFKPPIAQQTDDLLHVLKPHVQGW